MPGSSPHTRGAQGIGEICTKLGRIIPAYAGSTFRALAHPDVDRDHPRIRGEHLPCGGGVGVGVGSSPHTRGARRAGRAALHSFGIIPAYAGSTSATALRRVGQADHPRIRGEHWLSRGWRLSAGGSSPHTRGALPGGLSAGGACGIIPAYAGSTPGVNLRGVSFTDHPRIRGEHYACTVVTKLGEGSSPHTRGAHHRVHRDGDRLGIIPAYAGSTVGDWLLQFEHGDHPRIRGEHWTR